MFREPKFLVTTLLLMLLSLPAIAQQKPCFTKEARAAEFVRKAKTIIDVRCSK